MKNTALWAFFFIGGVSSVAVAEIAVLPRASLGIATSGVDIPVRGALPVTTNASYWALGIGATVRDEPYFAKVDANLGFSGSHNLFNTDGEFSRNEFSVSGGRTFSGNYEVFGGYRSAKSTFEVPAGTTLTELGSKGLFVGSSAFLVIRQVTRVSLTAVLNLLEGELTDNRGIGTSYGAKSKPGVGYGVSVDWSTTITDRLRLGAEVKNEFNNYRGWTDPNNPSLPAVKEANFSLLVGLSYLY